MTPFDAGFFDWLWITSVQASVLAVVVLVLDRAFCVVKAGRILIVRPLPFSEWEFRNVGR